MTATDRRFAKGFWRRLRKAALVLALAAVLAACAFIVAGAGHDCAGEGCTTCEGMLVCEAVLAGVGLLLCGFAAPMVLPRRAHGVREGCARAVWLPVRRRSLLTDSVRMDN